MSKNQTVIVCESSINGTDKKFIENLIIKNALLPADTFFIDPKGEIEIVKGFLKLTFPNQPYIFSKETKNVLIIVDADENPAKRFKEISACLDKQKFSVQKSFHSSIPKTKTKINVGIYLFPDNANKGSLETLLLKGLNHTHLYKKLQCIENYINCLGSKDGRITVNNKSKAMFRIFMSTPNPDRYVSSIINSVNFNSSKFKSLKKFIKQIK